MTRDLGETLDRSDELTRAGRHDEHLALMREALLLYPGELEILICAAEAHVVEAPEEAAELAREAVEWAPEDPVTLTRATSVMFFAERLEEARNLYIRAVRSAEDDFVLAGDLVYLGGQLSFAYGDEEKAQELFELAFDDQPKIPGRGFALAWLLDHRGEHERALEVVGEALRHRPGDQFLEELRVRLRGAVAGSDALPRDGR